MKSLAPILFSLLLAAGAVTASAQETNSADGLDFNSFDIIARKNIFDQSRTGVRNRGGSVRRQARIERITLLGINGDHGAGEAYFGGNGASDRFLKIGDHFDGFEVKGMTPDSVRLSNSNSVFVLDLVQRRSLRRVDDGPWEGSSDMSEPVSTSATTNTNSIDDVAASAPGAPAAADAPRPGESAIERKLRLRREQEEK
jgi:hypothetical protein